MQTDLFMGPALVGTVDKFPVSGVSFVLGNDLAEGKMGLA